MGFRPASVSGPRACRHPELEVNDLGRAPPVTLLELTADQEGQPAQGRGRTVATTSDLDLALTAQIAVAWAGEGGEEPRLS